jgi:signal transduction histidine kinase
MTRSNFSLGLRFSLTVGAILFSFCILFSVILYTYLKAQVIDEAEAKTVIIMTHVKAMGNYVKDSLRPKMFDLLAKTDHEEGFIIEAMSTTHINLQVMKRFAEDLPEYVYKRVSDKPLNSDNRANELHLQMIEYFEKNRNMGSWQGIEKINNREHLVYMQPVISDASCLKCHGLPDDAPRPITAKYGKSGKFGWRADAVVGVESVSIPLDVALADVKRVTLDTFIFGTSTLILLFLALLGIFRGLVTTPLNNLSRIFRGISLGTEPLGNNIAINRNDEIGGLTESFNLLSWHLLEAQEELKKTAAIEKQMMETEKLAALGQLSAGVAHEINNPLGGIRLCFNNLMDTSMDAEKRKQHIEVINSGFDRIQAIVKNLLDLSKNSKLSIAPANLNVLIESVLNLTEYTISRKGIRIVKKLSADLPEIPVDSNKIEQVLLNLIINAVQAMEEGGVLTITSSAAGEQCSISVSDTGRGIDPGVLSSIFNPFFTTKGVGEGTGLGLTVSKAIIEQHNGTIAVRTSDKGTVFTVLLPVKE